MTVDLLSTVASFVGPVSRPPALDARSHALFLDLDGTLTPIRATPGEVALEGATKIMLQRLVQTMQGAVALVSGRALADLERLSGGVVPALAGVHGLEVRAFNERTVRSERAAGLDEAVRHLNDFARSVPGLLVEDKILAATIHWRLAPTCERHALDLAEDLAGRYGLALQIGDHVAELKTPGADKGSAVRGFMREHPFEGRAPVFVGDDLTDEDGFTAAADLGGFGVLVAAQRASAALYRLPDVAAVHVWLGTPK